MYRCITNKSKNRQTPHQFWIDVRNRSWPATRPILSTSVEEAEEVGEAEALLKVTFEFRQDLYTPALSPVAPALLELLIVSEERGSIKYGLYSLCRVTIAVRDQGF